MATSKKVKKIQITTTINKNLDDLLKEMDY